MLDSEVNYSLCSVVYFSSQFPQYWTICMIERIMVSMCDKEMIMILTGAPRAPAGPGGPKEPVSPWKRTQR